MLTIVVCIILSSGLKMKAIETGSFEAPEGLDFRSFSKENPTDRINLAKTTGGINAILKVNAGKGLKGNPLSSSATAKSMAFDQYDSGESIELLDNRLMENFDGNIPTGWEAEGAVSKTGSCSWSTFYGVRLTGTDRPAALWQRVDLSRSGKEVREGDVLEGEFHYRGMEPMNMEGALNLMAYWTDADGMVIKADEDLFTNNSTIYFDRQFTWDAIKFRTTAPKGAKYFIFRLETNKHAIAEVDDFSLLKLSQRDKEKEFISVIPGYLVLNGETNKPINGRVLVQGFSIKSEKRAIIGGPRGALVMENDVLKKGNSVNMIPFTIQVAEKGIYGIGKLKQTFYIKYPLGGNRVGLTMTVNVVDGAKKPSIKLAEGTSVRTMTAFVKETDYQELTFDITNVIDNVNLSLKENGLEKDKAFSISTEQFRYGERSGSVFGNKVTVKFRPKEEKDYTATLCLTTACADTVKINLTGITAKKNKDWSEGFANEKEMDSRFKGEAWRNYHHFDKGYYYLDGRWTKKNTIEIDANGKLECDEIFVNGIKSIGVMPIMAAESLKAEISVDGGGHWQEVALTNGSFIPNTNRPTRFRLTNISSGEVTLRAIDVDNGRIEDRAKFNGIEQAMMLNADAQPLNKLEEYFENERHTRGLNMPGWQNIILQGNKSFNGCDQKSTQTGEIEEHCAQISFYNAMTNNSDPMKSWLVSPTLSYKNAASKIMTFRTRFEHPQDANQGKFGVWIITEDANGAKAQYIDITKNRLINDVEKDTWIDYCIDLSKVEGLQINDKFHIAFSFDAPMSGKTATLTYMIDDVTFGRTDITKPMADKDLVKFQFQPNEKSKAEEINITANNPKNPISVTVVPGRLKSQFSVNKQVLPAEGGTIGIQFFTKENRDEEAALLIQARGGESLLIKLIALNATSADQIEGNNIKVYPTIAEEVIRIDGEYESYYIFNMDGQLVQSGKKTESINISSLASGQYIVKVEGNKNVQNRFFTKK